MTKIENDINESYSPNLLFSNENRFEDDQVDFWPLKLTLKTENARFLSAHYYFYLQNIKISFEYVVSYTKSHWFLYPPFENYKSKFTIPLDQGFIKIAKKIKKFCPGFSKLKL